MKKTLIAFALVLCGALCASAQEYAYSLIVNKIDGSKVEYKFQSNPVASIVDQDLVISVDGSDEGVLHPIADLANLTFEKAESGVNNINGDSDNAGRVSFTVMPATLEAAGFPAGAEVSVFDMEGRVMANGVCDAAGSISLGIAHLDKGVFLVKAGNHNFKFIR